MVSEEARVSGLQFLGSLAGLDIRPQPVFQSHRAIVGDLVSSQLTRKTYVRSLLMTGAMGLAHGD